jgi:hypothetical protein
MKTLTLTLRLSRRAVAAVALDDESLAFCDGRHLNSRRDRAVAGATRYVARVLELTAPSKVLIDAPAKNGSTNGAILGSVLDLLAERKIVTCRIATADVLQAFGAPALHTRSELRRTTEAFWANIPSAVGNLIPFVLEAAAVALLGEALESLGGAPSESGTGQRV